MVPIFTYRDEGKLLALVGGIILAAVLALIQLDAVRNSRPSPIVTVITTLATWAQLATVTIVNGVRGGVGAVVALPSLEHDNGELRARAETLERTNAGLEEALARVPAERALTLAQLAQPHGIPATVIGFDPEGATKIVTIDRGAKDHIMRDDGVMTGDGVIGRITEVAPLSSKVLLISDPTSRLPAQVQRGRWWAIAIGTGSRIKLRYISQDAKLRIGDRVVTGEGRSFHAGITIGRISSIDPLAAGALERSATVDPTVTLSALSRVLVISK